MKFVYFSFLLLGVIQLCACYEHYQNAIPNGDKVNHPCLPNYQWKGVGHYNQRGGGPRNPFGIDFAAEGYKWTKQLCQKDSDGDGKSNGFELGDPDCTWTKGAIPKRTTAVTHPGVCEPVTTATCQQRNSQFTDLCKSPEFKCNATKSPDVMNMTIRFTNTTVPNQVTNYFCQSYEIPGNDTYHMIASEALIDNAEVMHHILLYGCNSKPSADTFTKASTCGMSLYGCFNIIGTWTVGIAGTCLPEQFGIRVGAGSQKFKYIVMQFHWNNPAQLSGMTDASGMRLYLTKNFRQNDGGIMMVGQRYLELPPGQVSVAQSMTCSKECTNTIMSTVPNITIIGSSIHMHYTGRYGKFEHWRNGQKVGDLVPYGKVEYDNPTYFESNPPIIFKRGDEFKLLCEYRTTDKTHTIYYGDGTQDEMCFAFSFYYPRLENDSCITYGPVDLCRTINVVGDCKLNPFYGYLYTIAPKLDEFCDFSVDYCSPQCKSVVRELLQQPCMQGWAQKYLYFISTFPSVFGQYLQKFRLQTAACTRELERETMTTKAPPPPMPKPFLNESTQLAILIAACVVGGLLILTVVVVGIVKALRQGSSSSNQKKELFRQNEYENGIDGPATHL